MRLASLLLAFGLVGCEVEVPNLVPINTNPTLDQDGASEGTLSRVRLNSTFGGFSANTRDGWGTAGTFGNAFTFDVRGRGEGIVMTQVTVHGADLGSLEPGDRIEADDIYGVGCAGHVEDQWDVDVSTADVELKVIDRTGDVVIIEFTANFNDPGYGVTSATSSGIVAIPFDGLRDL